MFPTPMYAQHQVHADADDAEGTRTENKSHVRESYSPRSMMQNRQRRRQQQPSVSPTRRSTASPTTLKGNATATATTNGSTNNNNNNNRLDMRYDDDEFAYTAHLIIHHLEQQQEQQRDARGEDHGESGCVNWNDFHQIWNYIQGGDESISSAGHPPPDRARTPLTDDLLAEFQFALKHRLKYISLQSPSQHDDMSSNIKEEPPIVVLTRQVAKLIAKSGFPKPKRSSREFSRHRDDTHTCTHSHAHEFAVVDIDESTTTMDTSQSTPLPPVNVQAPLPARDAAPAVVVMLESGKDKERKISGSGDTNVVAPTDQYASPLPPGLPAVANSNQYHYHPQTSTFDLQQENAEYIRQQYQRELLQQQQQQQVHAPIPWSYQEPVYEIPQFIRPDTVVDAYFEEEEFVAEPILDPTFHTYDNLLLDSNDIFVGIDRSFEEETVVMRQVTQRPPAHFPIVTADGSFSHNVMVSVVEQQQQQADPQGQSFQIPPKHTSERSIIPRQRIMEEEARRVTKMMNVTSHAQVKASCRARLDELRRELEQLRTEDKAGSTNERANNNNNNEIEADYPIFASPAVAQKEADYYYCVEDRSPNRRFFSEREEEKQSIPEVSFFSNDPHKHGRSSHDEKHSIPDVSFFSNDPHKQSRSLRVEKHSIPEVSFFSNDPHKQSRSSHVEKKDIGPEGSNTKTLVSRIAI